MQVYEVSGAIDSPAGQIFCCGPVIDRSYAVASSAGGLEGLQPSKNCFFPPDRAAAPPGRAGSRGSWGDTQRVPGLPKPLHRVTPVIDALHHDAEERSWIIESC